MIDLNIMRMCLCLAGFIYINMEIKSPGANGHQGHRPAGGNYDQNGIVGDWGNLGNRYTSASLSLKERLWKSLDMCLSMILNG